MIDNHKTHEEWKIQLTMQITFISSLDAEESHIMHLKSDSPEIVMVIKTDDIINELFKSFLRKYQDGLETKMKGSDFFLKVLIYCVIFFIK